MERIARFEKVSESRWLQDYTELFGKNGPEGTAGQKNLEEEALQAYGEIRLPRRATAGSAGYDLCTPVDIRLEPGQSMKIPTGIRVRMRQDYCLLIVPRSGLGSKFRFQLNNTAGVIDSDYYYSDNEGHIFVPMINDSRDGRVVELKKGTAFAQSLFVSYGITEDDDTETVRNGGFGSTGT